MRTVRPTMAGEALALTALCTRPKAQADPRTAAFHGPMGARFLRNTPSDAIPDCTSPLYEYDLTSGDRR